MKRAGELLRGAGLVAEEAEAPGPSKGLEAPGHDGHGSPGETAGSPRARPTAPPSDSSPVNLSQRARCSARSKRSGLPCQNPPMRGGRVCRMHGGAAPRARAAAAAELTRRRVAAEAARLGGRLDVEPVEALAMVWQGAAADVVALEAMVGALDAAELAGPAGVALSRMLAEARGTARQAAKAALDAGVDERRVRIGEATTARVVAAVVGGLEECAALLPAEALPAVRAAIARRLKGDGGPPALGPPRA